MLPITSFNSQPSDAMTDLLSFLPQSLLSLNSPYFQDESLSLDSSSLDSGIESFNEVDSSPEPSNYSPDSQQSLSPGSSSDSSDRSSPAPSSPDRISPEHYQGIPFDNGSLMNFHQSLNSIGLPFLQSWGTAPISAYSNAGTKSESSTIQPPQKKKRKTSRQASSTPSLSPGSPIYEAAGMSQVVASTLPSSSLKFIPAISGSNAQIPIAKEPLNVLDTKGLVLAQATVQELLEEKDIQKKRLARKAELARLSRRKKKLRMGDLEQQVAQLQAERDRLQKENKALAERAELEAPPVPTLLQSPLKNKGNQEPSVEVLVDALAQADPSEVEHALEAKISAIARAIESQAATVERCMRVIEKSITPCLPMTFLQWAFDRNEKFYENESGLFFSLFRDEMGATPQQMAQLTELRQQIKKQNNEKAKEQHVVLEAFKQLEQYIKQKAGSQQVEMFEKFRAIFTPRQLALYFKWVAKFGSICIKINV